MRVLDSQCRQQVTYLDESSGEPFELLYSNAADRIRWTIVWQDSLLSLSFDRSPIAIMTRCQLPLGPRALTEGFSYTEVMYHLCAKILESVNNDSATQPSFSQIMEDSAYVENLRHQVSPSFREKDSCKTVQDRLHHYAVHLHSSFVISVLCRPSLRRGDNIGMTPDEKAVMAARCKASLAETVRMYLKMHSLSVIPTRSWAFTYHGLSSAVLLGILGETKTDPEVRQLQGDLISALSATAGKEHQTAFSVKTDKDIELSGPLSRALTALKNIYDHGWVVETKAPNSPTQYGQDQGTFEQQNAAIAMASMQNGMIPPVDYSSQMQMMPEVQGAEQTLNMSPMDLFDSIFWGEAVSFFCGYI
jgi:hypothetical protein